MKKCPKCKGVGYVQDDSEIGKDLSIKRREALLTLREVSASMGLSISYVCDLEKGRKKWTEKKKADFLQAIKRG